MLKTRRLLHGQEITYPEAVDLEAVNVLQQLNYYHRHKQFFDHLNDQRSWMRCAAAHHLGLPSNKCQVSEVKDWVHGTFNVCIPITVDWKRKRQAGNRVLLRIPLPYRFCEASGNSDEKIRCEAGTYSWLQQNCPDVPIPHLYGFAMSTGETFTATSYLPYLYRVFERFRRQILQFFGLATPSHYIRHQPGQHFKMAGIGYILIEYMEESQGTMLSNTWPSACLDKTLRANFFRGLSHILLSITRIPLPRIGSFIIDNDGFLQLNNRPLSIELQLLESDNIPTGISRHYTYSSVDPYIADLLAAHDSRLRNQPNAIKDISDFAIQSGALAAMRTISCLFFDRNLRHGPFVLSLTDLHQSNILVDDELHIRCLVDLEWACSRPIEMIVPPYWLTDEGVEIDPAKYEIYRAEFLEILISEEKRSNISAMPSLSDVMKKTWESGTFWYSLALLSPTGLFSIFYKRIQPELAPFSPEFYQIMSLYWTKNVGAVIGEKMDDKIKYDIDLEAAFTDPVSLPQPTCRR